MQVFGNSPDETAYFRIALNREAVPDALLAIQPSLLAYQLEQPVQVWSWGWPAAAAGQDLS